MILFFALGPAIHLQTDLGDNFWEALGHKHGIDPADVKAIAEATATACRGNVASAEKSALFRELQRDPAIAGVGVTDDLSADARPVGMISRQDFTLFTGDFVLVEEPVRRQTVFRTLTATVIKPVLTPEDNRAWRFQIGDAPEFSAKMQDPIFRQAMADRRVPATLAYGVEMEFDVRDREELRDGLWHVVSRVITHVRSPRIGEAPLQLPFDEDDYPGG